MSVAAPAGESALVVRVSGPTATVRIGDEEHEAALPPRIAGGPAVAGDRVAVERGGGLLRVASIAARTTRLQRGAGGRGAGARTLVANADLLVIVASVVQPPLRIRLLDRYLVAGAAGGLTAAVVVTKTDLPHDAPALAEVVERYRGLGYPVLCGCAWDPGLAGAVGALIGRRLAVLAGHSGVGKSTLTNALTGVERAVGAVSAKAGKGRHTTSDPRLVPLRPAVGADGGNGDGDRGAVVDTAGVRTFHLPPLTPEALAAGFPEIAAAAPECRFRGCRHDGDAGCAVGARAHPERLESYRRMLRDLRC